MRFLHGVGAFWRNVRRAYRRYRMYGDFERTSRGLESALIEIEGAGTFRLLRERMLRGDTRQLLIATRAEKACRDALVGGDRTEEPIFDAIVASGRLFDLLGGGLAPEGTEWTPRLGRETAEKLKRVQSPAGKRAIARTAVAIFQFVFWAAIEQRPPQSVE